MSVVKNPQKVYVGNLPRDVTESQIEKLFREVGKVIGFEFKGDFAFVEFDDAYAAEEAGGKKERKEEEGKINKKKQETDKCNKILQRFFASFLCNFL
ncbi:hypothetical protein RFI_09626 [Reticulomyxa filosa]|uniref:RRM domain-containing protein n=1 Tax=Reticulomyxa filosa TaxID=46433 RepID=X6NQ66_RETFI|nr:hypothetical protein RFI_09626 [Reticulomyxa filosa]|eukprot:ETO27502.1 hypothetical protein RFI_09626 [Reticulomyxa filosa]